MRPLDRVQRVSGDRGAIGSLASDVSEGVVEQQRVAGRPDHRPLDDVLQLADVAGPAVLLERRASRPAGTLVMRRPRSRWWRWMKNQTSDGMSSTPLAQRRQVDRVHAQAIVQVRPEPPARPRRLRDRGASPRSPGRRRAASATSRPARTRPPAAPAAAWPGSRAAGRRSRRGRSCRRRPARSAPAASQTAPVKAPFSWPNSSLSTSVGGSAAQLTRTSARARRRLRSCSARANSSLPVPVSPSSSTDEFIGATCPRRVSATRSDALSPTMSSKSW